MRASYAISSLVTSVFLLAEVRAASFRASHGFSSRHKHSSFEKRECDAYVDITGIDYNQQMGHPFARFVLAFTDKDEAQQDRLVIGIPSCTDWWNASGAENIMYNIKPLQTLKENPANNKFAQKACQTFYLHYAPSALNKFDRAYITTSFATNSTIGWANYVSDAPPNGLGILFLQTQYTTTPSLAEVDGTLRPTPILSESIMVVVAR